MSKNVLIRNLDDDVIALVEEIKPRGIAQNEFLKSLIGYSLQDYRQPSLFREEVRTINNPVRLPFTFIDLFAGIGGFRSALTKLGGRCLFTNEIDKYAAATYSAWYNDTNISNQDIYQVDIEEEIPSHDILCAGFP